MFVKWKEGKRLTIFVFQNASSRRNFCIAIITAATSIRVNRDKYRVLFFIFDRLAVDNDTEVNTRVLTL